MSALVNTIGITLGLGLLGLGGWGAVVLLDKEPTPYVLNRNEAQDSSKSYTENTTIGGIEANKKILVANIKHNASWFNWSLRNLLMSKKSENNSNMADEFKEVITGYSEDEKDEKTALNKVCETYYKKTHNDVKSSEQKIKQSLQSFCSFDRSQDIIVPASSGTQ